MSGFDVTFRSQIMTEEARQFQDSRRDHANAQIGQSVGQLGASAIDTMRYEREFAMQQADTAMRHQLAQQEMQLNDFKLQQMAAIDMVDMSREQLRAQRLSNDSMEVEVTQKKKMLASMDSDRRYGTFAQVARALGGEELAAMGYVADPTSGQFRQVKGTEQEELLARFRGLRGSRGRDSQQIRTSIGLEISRLTKELDSISTAGDPDSKARAEEIRRILPQLRAEYENQLPGYQPEATEEPQATGPTQQGLDFDPQVRAQTTQSFRRLLDQPAEDPMFSSLVNVDSETKDALAQGFAIYGDLLSRFRNISPDMAPAYVRNMMRSGDALPVAFALRAAGYSDARIEAWMRAVGIYKTEAQLQSAMRRHREEIDQMLRPVRR